MNDFAIASLADLNSHPIEGIARMGNKPFKVDLYSHIKDNLWTGGCPVSVAPRDFQTIVCLYPWQPYKRHEHQTYLEARLYDVKDIPDAKVLYALAGFVRAACTIGPTLVHCQAGLNRSALVAALSLILDGMEPDDAINLMREKRCDAVLCNHAFESWLRQQKRATDVSQRSASR